MICGIGVDMVTVSDMERRVARMSPGALARMFTPAEIEASLARGNRRAEYLATRFAAKEAVYKALAPSLGKGRLELRRIEILNRSDGSPYANTGEASLAAAMQKAGVAHVHLSITTEGDFACAFAVAEK